MRQRRVGLRRLVLCSSVGPLLGVQAPITRARCQRVEGEVEQGKPRCLVRLVWKLLRSGVGSGATQGACSSKVSSLRVSFRLQACRQRTPLALGAFPSMERA